MQQDFIPPSWLFLPLRALVQSLLPLPTHAARPLTPAQVFPIATCSPSHPNASSSPEVGLSGLLPQPSDESTDPCLSAHFKPHASPCPLTLRATCGFSITANLLIGWKRAWDAFSAQQGQSNRPNSEQLQVSSTVHDNFLINSIHNKYKVIRP